MKKLLLPLLFTFSSAYSLLFSFSAHAEQPLSKDLIQQYAQTTEQLDQLLVVYPDAEEQVGKVMMMSKNERLALIQSMDIFPKIKAIVTDSGFDNVEHFLALSTRISGATMNVEMKKSPDDMNLDEYIQQMKAYIATMKNKGMAQDAVSEMEANINHQISSMKSVLAMVENASEADIKFVTDNQEWIMQLLDEE
ncbi:MAG: hypothetical protein WBC60_00330 [Cognaticolwellia sp.]